MEQAISLVCEQPKVTRRTLLTGLASITGAAIGSGAVTGFPIVWAQKLKDITLVQVGGSYSSIIDIGRQATKDLGFEIKMQNAVTDALVNRAATQPESIDIADLEFWSLKKLLRRRCCDPSK
jgi:putative spermidine/putrescine transport system substrate-binding protein